MLSKSPMKRVLALQIAAVFLVSLLAGGIFGKEGAISAGIVAASVVIPNGLLVLLLLTIQNAFAFLMGEMLKILLTIGFLVVFVGLYPSVHWPSFLLSLIVVLQVAFLALWKKQDERK